jgi:hypothetical protein
MLDDSTLIAYERGIRDKEREEGDAISKTGRGREGGIGTERDWERKRGRDRDGERLGEEEREG